MSRDPAPSTAGHRRRLKDKYLERGIDSLTDSELVELLLTLSTPRADTKPMARAALERFGGLRGVLEAEADQWAEIPGLGRRNILALKLVHDTARRFLRDRLTGRPFLSSPRAVFDYLYHSLRDRRTEAVKIIFLDAKDAVLDQAEPFSGGPSSGGVDLTVIVRLAIETGAVGVVMVHNHPSGRTEPSTDDQRLTRSLVIALASVGVRLVDHLIIGENRYHSFSETGYISRCQAEFNAFDRA